MDTATAWHLVLTPDGIVMAATDGAPRSWVGTPLADLDDAPDDLKEAGRELLDTAYHSASSAAALVPLKSVDHSVHLTVVDALPIRRVPTDLRTLLGSTLEPMQRQARAVDVTLKIVVEPDVPASVCLDGEKIAWAISVLVGNSLRYVHHGSMMMPGGTITVRVAYNSSAPEVTLQVEDDGSGIPPDKIPVLFKSSPGQPRVGVGLPMVREVVGAHSGHLEIESETQSFSRGTTIRITVPV